MRLSELVNYLDKTLDLAAFASDTSNNGLQLEASAEVKKAVFAVDAAQETIETAASMDADFLFVHHGLSWGSYPKRWVGIDGKRFCTLAQNNISLYAAHLPLDAHAIYGNNASICNILEIEDRKKFFTYAGVEIGFSGRRKVALTISEYCDALSVLGDFTPIIRGDEKRRYEHVAVVSGGAGREAIAEAASIGAELLITGEFDHTMHHCSLEEGVAVLAVGHYLSETVGPLAMMGAVQREFGIDACFAEIPTGL